MTQPYMTRHTISHTVYSPNTSNTIHTTRHTNTPGSRTTAPAHSRLANMFRNVDSQDVTAKVVSVCVFLQLTVRLLSSLGLTDGVIPEHHGRRFHDDNMQKVDVSCWQFHAQGPSSSPHPARSGSCVWVCIPSSILPLGNLGSCIGSSVCVERVRHRVFFHVHTTDQVSDSCRVQSLTVSATQAYISDNNDQQHFVPDISKTGTGADKNETRRKHMDDPHQKKNRHNDTMRSVHRSDIRGITRRYATGSP